MKTWLKKSSGILSIIAFVMAWIYFAFVVWISNHPSLDNYVHGTLHLDAGTIMLSLFIVGAALGIYAERMLGRIWLVLALLNGLSFVVVLLSPKAVL